MLNKETDVKKCLNELEKANIEKIGSKNTTTSALCLQVGLCQESHVNLNEEDAFIKVNEFAQPLTTIEPIPEISAKERKKFEMNIGNEKTTITIKMEDNHGLVQINPNSTEKPSSTTTDKKTPSMSTLKIPLLQTQPTNETYKT